MRRRLKLFGCAWLETEALETMVEQTLMREV